MPTEQNPNMTMQTVTAESRCEDKSSARPIRVAHALLSMDCGGMENVVLELARRGPATGQDVHVICLERRGDLAGALEKSGAHVQSLDKRPGVRVGMFWKLRSVLKKLRPDVLHTHTIGSLFYAGLPARTLRIPVVVHTEHGKEFTQYGKKTQWMSRLAARSADRFFCVSKDIYRELQLARIVEPARLSVVYNGIDTNHFRRTDAGLSVRQRLGIPSTVPIIGTVGRLSEVKCQDLLIQAVAELRRESVDARLLIVGDGPRMSDLRKLAESLGMLDAVHFVGYQERRESFYSAMDVFALTSRSEGTPLVVLEAFASGLPVVAAAVGGIPELIEDGRNGFLFPSGDVGRLATTIRNLLNDDSLMKRVSQTAVLDASRRFDASVMSDTYMSYYRRLLTETRHQNSCCR